MAYVKRTLIATILGIAAGFVCYLGGMYGAGIEFTIPMILATIFNRAILGFVIGISGLKKLHYMLHGVIIGAVVSVPFALSGGISGLLMFTLFGIIYGFLIELLTTKVFKAPMG